MRHEKEICIYTLGDIKYIGDILIDGENTSLTITSDNRIPYDAEPHSIYGELLNHTKVSLYECVGGAPDPEGTYPDFIFRMESFPHYGVLGPRHVTEHERVFESISFSCDDLGLIFSPEGSFGVARANKESLEAMLKNGFQRNSTQLGEHPIVFYYSDTQNKVSEDISQGIFIAELLFKSDITDHTGITCSASSWATLNFKELKTFSDALDSLIDMLSFLNAISGRRQGIQEIKASAKFPSDENTEVSEVFKVHWSHASTTSKIPASQKRDIPITPDKNRNEFYEIFKEWMIRQETWSSSRRTILNSQHAGRVYDANRLVVAANAFDVLPKSCYPVPEKLSEEALEIKRKCKELIKSLSNEEEKTQILNTLAFWGNDNLKTKVLARAVIVKNNTGILFDGIETIVEIAIKTRNYFVHGQSSFNFINYEDYLPFLVDTLEFIFMASDFIECGWKSASVWSQKTLGFSHPFANFKRLYQHYAWELIELYLKNNKK